RATWSYLCNHSDLNSPDILAYAVPAQTASKATMTYPSPLDASLYARCMEELDRLDAEEQWELTPSERHKLVEAVAQLVGERATPAQIRTTLQNYWQSAPQVEAL